MSEIRVNTISSYDGTDYLTFGGGDTFIGVQNQKVLVNGSLMPGNNSSNLMRPEFKIITGNLNTDVSISDGYSGSLLEYTMNTVHVVTTEIERQIRLPKGSIQGDWITITDIGSGASNSGNASKRNITILPNSNDRIQGGTAGDTFILDIDAQSVTLMWCGDTYHWRLVDF